MVGPAGPRLLERREATSLEEEQLVATAEALRERLEAAGLDVALVGDHLNRRSIDLMPDWPEPSGSQRRGAPAAGGGAAARGRLRWRADGVHGAGARDRPRSRPDAPSRHQRPAAHRHRPHRQGGRHACGDARPDHRASPAAAGPAGAGRHVRTCRGRARDRFRDAHPRAAPRRVRQRRRGAGRGAAAGAARRRWPGRVPGHPARPARDARDRRPAELSRAERRPILALRGQGLRPVPRARGRDVAHGRQRRDRHARGARGGLGDLDAGHPRRRRLRRRDQRSALPPAGPGAGLDRPAAHGGRQRPVALQRRDPRAREGAGPAARHRLPHLATAAAERAHGAAAHGAVRLAGRPSGDGGAGGGDPRGLRRLAGLAERHRRDARRRADQGDVVRGARRPTRSDREHAGPQGRRARARGDDQPGARLARGAHAPAGARRDRRAPRAGRPGDGGPARGDRLGAHQGAVAGGRAPRPRAGAGRRLRRAAAATTGRRGTPPGRPPTCASTATPTTSTRCASPSTT